MWQGCIKGKHIVGSRARGRHHDRWRTIGGGIPHQNVNRYEIKTQVIGEDADLESGRMLNCVTELSRDGITIDADQRHVRDRLKGIELERASHFGPHCAVKRKDEGGARSDESKGENRCGQVQT